MIAKFEMKKFIYYIVTCILILYPLSSYSKNKIILSGDKLIQINNIGNIYILSNSGQIVDDIHFLDTIKEEFQNNSELNIIDVYKEKNHIVILLDRFGGRYYEYFYVSFKGTNPILKSILTRSIAREDFDGKTLECKKYINVPLKQYQYHFDESKNQDFNCVKKYLIENDLSDLRKLLKDSFYDKDLIEINDIDNHRIDYYLSRFPLSDKTITQYNDIAYHLAQHKNFETSNYLLEKIIKKFPYRAISYLNIGDNHLKSGNKELALFFYKKYIDLMIKQRNKSKIPNRIYEIAN